MNKNLSKGFTLVEILIVIAILGILAAIAIPAYNDYIEKGELADAKQAALSARQNFEANRLARPRNFQTVNGFITELQRATAGISGKNTKYTFTPKPLIVKNVPVSFSFEIRPKNKGKKYYLTIDEDGNASRCTIKSSECEKF